MTPAEAADLLAEYLAKPATSGCDRPAVQDACHVLIDHARASDEPWCPKVLVVRAGLAGLFDSGGSSVEWSRADIVVTPDGTVLKNKYGPTGWTDWKS